MPHELTYGSESAANKAIGGVPVIHYFDFQSRGRGQVVRLLLIVGCMFIGCDMIPDLVHRTLVLHIRIFVILSKNGPPINEAVLSRK